MKDNANILYALDNITKISQLSEFDVFYHLLYSLYPKSVKSLIKPLEPLDPEKKSASRLQDYAKFLQMKFQELFKTDIDGLSLSAIKEMLNKEDVAYFQSEDFTKLLILFVSIHEIFN